MAISEQAVNVVLRSVLSEDFGDKKRSWEREKPPVVDWCLNPASLMKMNEKVWTRLEEHEKDRKSGGLIVG